MKKKRNRSNTTPAAVGGAARRKELGLVTILVELTKEERQAVRVAAANAGESSAAFVRRVLKETTQQ